MSVYVKMRFMWPTFQGRRYERGCPMLADTDAELEAMARKLKVRQDRRYGDHYTLTASERRKAVAAGAIELSARQMVRVRRRIEEMNQCIESS